MFGLTGLSKWLAAAVVVMTAVSYILFNTLVDAKAQVTTLKATNDAYVAQVAESLAVQKMFEMSHSNITLAYQKLEAQAKKDSERGDVATKKPGLVQKLANKKFKKQEREMACLTGNQSKCSLQ